MKARRPGSLCEGILLVLSATLFYAGYGWNLRLVEPFQDRPPQEGVLRTVTWNVGNGLSKEGEPLRYTELEHVAGRLRHLDPDLCFLQEVESPLQLEHLRGMLGPDWRAASARGGNRYVAALCQRGELERVDAPSLRRTIVVIYRPRSGPPILAVGMHADAFSSRRRNREIGGAVNMLRSRSRVPAILAGDLNLDVDLDKRRDLFSDDSYLDVETYNVIAGHLTDAGSGAGSTAEPDRRLDYIFVDTRAFTVRNAGPWKGQRASQMDHDPVVADFVVTTGVSHHLMRTPRLTPTPLRSTSDGPTSMSTSR